MQIKHIVLYFLIILSFGFTISVNAETEQKSNPFIHTIPAWFYDGFLDLSDDLATAKEENKKLMLFFDQNGCPYCQKMLQDNFSYKNKEIIKKYKVIALNIFGDREVTDFDGEVLKEKDFSLKYKVQFTPTIMFFDSNGLIARLNGYRNLEQFTKIYKLAYQTTGKQDFYKNINNYKNKSGNSRKYKFNGNNLLIYFRPNKCIKDCKLLDQMLAGKHGKKLIKRFKLITLRDNDKLELHGNAFSKRRLFEQLRLDNQPSLVVFENLNKDKALNKKEIFRIDSWFKKFHLQVAAEYLSSDAYKTQPSFQRYLNDYADSLRDKGIHVDIWE